MKNLFYIAAMVYSVAAFIYAHQTEMTISNNWIFQTAIIGLGGLYLLVSNNASAIASFKLPSFSSANPEKNLIYTPKTYEERDLECLLHIKNRLIQAKSSEGIKIWKNLANIMIELDIPELNGE